MKLLFSKPSVQRRNRKTTPRVMGGIGHGAAPAHCHSNAASLQAHLAPRWDQPGGILSKVSAGGKEVESAKR